MLKTPIDIIHEADEVVLSAYNYTQIYATGTTTVTINGNEIQVPAGVVKLEILDISI